MSAATDPDVPPPQRAVIVLPTTGEFDSRTYRIASSLAARGHTVTVLARLAPGLPVEELHPAGYRIVRVSVSAIDGLPLPRWARETIDRSRARRRGGGAGRAATGRASTGAGEANDDGAAGTPRRLSAPRRLVSGLTRVAAIALTVRSQARATRGVAPQADVVHGMAYMGIPIALDLGRRTGARVVYDARDIYTDANNLARLPRGARLVLGRVERGWARRADRVMTVNAPYADVMAERFGVPRPAIVMNCSYRYDPPDPAPRRIRDRLGLDAATGIVLYQGGFSRERGIEQLIEAIAAVPDAVLVLMGYGPLQAELEARVADPASAGRIRLLPAVPPTELLDWVASADVVAMPIQPTTLNHRLTTPNKLLEAMAAGIPVVASDLPGMADIVRDSGCGLLVDPTDPAAISAALRRILTAPDDERRAWRRRALAAAHERYNWERQVDVLLTEYAALTGRRW